MGAPVDRAKTVVSFKANATISAYRILKLSAANTVALHDTSTALILGVSDDDSSGGANSAIKVVIDGTAKIQCGASVSVGALCTAQTATGLLIESANTFTTTAASLVPKTIGIALASGSTNSTIEVLLNINNISKIG